MRIAILVISLCLFGGSGAAAQTTESSEPDTMATSDDGVAKLTYRAGSSTVEVQAPRGIDVQALLVAAKIRPNDAPEVIVDKVNAVRERLYPHQEIALTASVPRTKKVDPEGIVLYRYYIYWNRASGFYAWWTQMSAAVTFLGRTRGTWDYWECNRCSSWRYMKRIFNGGSLTRALYGGAYKRGFQYRPVTSGARADIVMYFFY